ncbi:MAG: Holliday junction resolvase Hjc [Nanoarchaeota archaeon]|nr:Holliday junction resolvase Hjc [Nanoarchaeota archaeon]
MSNKAKGSRVERELVEIFTENNWRAVRVAGSGVKDESPCDIITAKIGKRGYVVEAKSSKKNRIYIKKEQIEDFMKFSLMTGLSAVIAVRFNYEGWLFITPSQLDDTGKYWVISLEKAKSEGKKFSQFFEG